MHQRLGPRGCGPYRLLIEWFLGTKVELFDHRGEWDDCALPRPQDHRSAGVQPGFLPDPLALPLRRSNRQAYGVHAQLPRTPNPNPGNDLSPASLDRHRACSFASVILTDCVIHAYRRPTELFLIFFATYMNPSYWPGTQALGPTATRKPSWGGEVLCRSGRGRHKTTVLDWSSHHARVHDPQNSRV